MTDYLKANGTRIFDFSNFSQPLTKQIWANAQRIADENGIEIGFIHNLHASRKDEHIQEIILETGKTKRLVRIFIYENYQYLEFISSFNDHSNGNENLIKATSPVVEKRRSY